MSSSKWPLERLHRIKLRARAALDKDRRRLAPEIVGLAEAGHVDLIAPAFSLAEPWEPLRRRHSVDGDWPTNSIENSSSLPELLVTP